MYLKEMKLWLWICQKLAGFVSISSTGLHILEVMGRFGRSVPGPKNFASPLLVGGRSFLKAFYNRYTIIALLSAGGLRRWGLLEIGTHYCLMVEILYICSYAVLLHYFNGKIYLDHLVMLLSYVVCIIIQFIRVN